MNELQQSIDDVERDLLALERMLVEHEQTLARMRDEIAGREQIIETLKVNLRREHKLAAQLQKPFPTDETDVDTDYKIVLALTLANAAYDALLVVDENCKIIAINNSAESLLKHNNPIGSSLQEITGAPELDMMVMDALANEEESFEEQIVIDRRPFRVRTQVIRRAGNVFIGLALQDVSELVRLNRARRDMVANISHELRTPIANIRLIIEGLFHEQDKPKRKQSTTALKTIARETDSLIWLVQELLDLSMIESGQSILRAINQPLRPLVTDAIERLEDQSEMKDVKLIDETPEEIMVLADGDHIRRVLINLMHNAIKWSPQGDVVKVRARVERDEVVISVLDNGPGVPEEHRERIFERFYQVEPSRSGKEGSGLGLAICRHIVEAHDGRIWVENNPDRQDGAGGCFYFTLPVADESALRRGDPDPDV